jgi:UPF0716 protein FxsA
MVFLLGLAVVVVLELYVFVQAAQWLGFFAALLVVIVVSLAGVALVKREGLRTLRRFQQQARQGRLPSRELADAVTLLIAGGLLAFPGLVTDVVGLLLLTPPVRLVVRRRLIRSVRGASGVVITEATVTEHIVIDPQAIEGEKPSHD